MSFNPVNQTLREIRKRKIAVYKFLVKYKLELQELESAEKMLEKKQPKSLCFGNWAR